MPTMLRSLRKPIWLRIDYLLAITLILFNDLSLSKLGVTCFPCCSGTQSALVAAIDSSSNWSGSSNYIFYTGGDLTVEKA